MRWTVALVLVALAVVSAVTHLVAESTRRRRLVYATKPLTTTLLVIVAALGTAPPAYRWLVVLGLIFSVAGDVFLMLPRDRFVAGLVAFLVAHIVYTAAFSTEAPFLSRPALFIPYVVVAGAILVVLWKGLPLALRVPVLVYVLALVVMAGQAAAVSTLVAIGAALFVISDATLAVDRFRISFPAAQGVIMTTYVAAQTLIALSTHA